LLTVAIVGGRDLGLRHPGAPSLERRREVGVAGRVVLLARDAFGGEEPVVLAEGAQPVHRVDEGGGAPVERSLDERSGRREVKVVLAWPLEGWPAGGPQHRPAAERVV